MKVLTVSDLLVIFRVSCKVGKRVYFGVKRIALQLGTDSVLSIGYNRDIKVSYLYHFFTSSCGLEGRPIQGILSPG